MMAMAPLGTEPTAALPQEPATSHRDWPATSARIVSRYGSIAALVILCIIFSIEAPSVFPTTSNVIAILNDVAIYAVIAGGVTLPLAAGEFDLSIGYVASFSGVLVTSFAVKQNLPLFVAVLLTLLICAAIGLINGFIVTRLGVNSFICTLATGTIVVGANYAVSAGVPITSGLPTAFIDFNLRKIIGIPLPVYVTALVLLVLWIALNRTVFGINIQAIGQNAEAAHLAGVRVARVRLMSLVVSSVCAGGGGIMLAARLGSGEPTAADGYLLTGFAAAFLGSVALRDSEFHIVGTIIGVLTLGVALNGLAVLSVPAFWEYVVQGGLLIGAVALSTLARRYLTRR
jgi:ribose transport system permease protein